MIRSSPDRRPCARAERLERRVLLAVPEVYSGVPHFTPEGVLRFRFSEDVSGSLSASDLSLRDLKTDRLVEGAVAGEPVREADGAVVFPLADLPVGDYRATLSAAGVTNAEGVPLAADYVVDFRMAASLGGDGTLAVVGDDTADAVEVVRHDSGCRVQFDGVVYEFPVDAVRRVDVRTFGGADSVLVAKAGGGPAPTMSIDAGDGDDQVRLRGGGAADAGVTVAGGAGDDTVSTQPIGLFSNRRFLGPASFDGGEGTDALLFFDELSANSRFAVTDEGVRRGEEASVGHASLEKVVVRGNTGDDAFDVSVRSAVPAIELYGEGGNDTFTRVADPAAPPAATPVRVKIDGGGGDDRTIANGTDRDDVIEAADAAVTVNGFTFAPAVGAVQVDALGGNDRLVFRRSLAPGVPGVPRRFFLRGGAGDDVLEGSAGPAYATLGGDGTTTGTSDSFDGGDGSDRVSFQSVATQREYVKVYSDRMFAIGFSLGLSSAEWLAVSGSPQADSLEVISTAASMPVRVAGGGGADAYTIGAVPQGALVSPPASPLGAVTLETDADDSVFYYDDRTGAAADYVVTATRITRTAFAPVEFNRPALVGLFTTTGANVIDLAPDRQTRFGVSDRGGADRLRVGPDGLTGVRFSWSGGGLPGSGSVWFADRLPRPEAVSFSGIEEVDDVFVPYVLPTARYELAQGRATVRVPFDDDVSGSLDAADLLLRHVASGEAVAAEAVRFNRGGPGGTAVFTLPLLRPGQYEATVPAAGVADDAGNRMEADHRFTFVPGGAVVGRRVFYNDSAFDGRDPDPTAADLAAVAPDKEALPFVAGPPAAATFASVTSYARGINGVLVDFAGVAPEALVADDFAFLIEDRATGGLSAAPPPDGVARLHDPAAPHLARYAITWGAGAVRNGWLRVAVTPGARTALAAADVFSFGNLVGEAGDAPGNASVLAVTARDLVSVRSAFGRAGLAAGCDFDRDGRVGATDLLAARRALGRTLALAPPAAPSAPAGVETDAGASVSAVESVSAGALRLRRARLSVLRDLLVT